MRQFIKRLGCNAAAAGISLAAEPLNPAACDPHRCASQYRRLWSQDLIRRRKRVMKIVAINGSPKNIAQDPRHRQSRTLATREVCTRG